MAFFYFNQNNSGGSFWNMSEVEGAEVHHVIVEASNEEEANKIALSVGVNLYDDTYCRCCGPRWMGCDNGSDSIEEIEFVNDSYVGIVRLGEKTISPIDTTELYRKQRERADEFMWSFESRMIAYYEEQSQEEDYSFNPPLTFKLGTKFKVA